MLPNPKSLRIPHCRAQQLRHVQTSRKRRVSSCQICRIFKSKTGRLKPTVLRSRLVRWFRFPLRQLVETICWLVNSLQLKPKADCSYCKWPQPRDRGHLQSYLQTKVCGEVCFLKSGLNVNKETTCVGSVNNPVVVRES